MDKNKNINRILLLLYIVLPYYYFKKNWSSYEDYISPYHLRSIFPTVIQILVIFLALMFFIPLYKYKIPYFEQFKINDFPWEWEQNEKKWKKTLRNLIWIYFRNYFLLAPVITTFFHEFSDTAASLSDYPSL